MKSKRMITGIIIGIVAAILWSVVFIRSLNSMAGLGVGICLGISFGISGSLILSKKGKNQWWYNFWFLEAKGDGNRSYDQNRKNGKKRHNIRQRFGYGDQLYNLAICWLGHFSRIAELGICALFCFTILTFCFSKPLPQRTLPAAHALLPWKKKKPYSPIMLGIRLLLALLLRQKAKCIFKNSCCFFRYIFPARSPAPEWGSAAR